MREGDCARGACFRLIGIVAGGKPVEANAAVALAGGGGGACFVADAFGRSYC